jgi:hypothetical protein
METTMGTYPHPEADAAAADHPVARSVTPLPEPTNPGMSAIGPMGALVAGILGFGLFVFGATQTETGGQSQQAAAQQQEQQRQNPPGPATTGLSPQAQERELARGTETTGAAPVEQQRDNLPSEARTGVPGR